MPCIVKAGAWERSCRWYSPATCVLMKFVRVGGECGEEMGGSVARFKGGWVGGGESELLGLLGGLAGSPDGDCLRLPDMAAWLRGCRAVRLRGCRAVGPTAALWVHRGLRGLGWEKYGLRIGGENIKHRGAPQRAHAHRFWGAGRGMSRACLALGTAERASPLHVQQ